MEYGLGAVPSRADRRDYSIASFRPVRAALGEYMPPEIFKTQNQGAVGACVAYGIEHQVAVLNHRETGRLIRYDPNYIYGYRAETDYQGEGMVPREALQTLRRNGIAEQGQLPWPYAVFYAGLRNHSHFWTPQVHANALYQRVLSFYSVQGENEIDTALPQGPVGLVIPVYDSFIHCPPNGILALPEPLGERFHGYHYIVVIGKRKDRRYVIQHWWGDWGDQSKLGYCMAYLPVNYPITEAWGIIDEELPRPARHKVVVTLGEALAVVDGERRFIDPYNPNIRAYVTEGRTMLPARFLAESLGLSINYNPATNEVTIERG